MKKIIRTLVWVFIIGFIAGILSAFLSGCKKSIPDGLYVGRKLVIANATVEQFCQAGDNTQLIRNGKEKLSK